MHYNIFFRFPQNIERKNKWLEALNLKNYTPRKTAAVCSANFRKNDYEPGHSYHKLKKDAFPYVNIMNNKFNLCIV